MIKHKSNIDGERSTGEAESAPKTTTANFPHFKSPFASNDTTCLYQSPRAQPKCIRVHEEGAQSAADDFL